LPDFDDETFLLALGEEVNPALFSFICLKWHLGIGGMLHWSAFIHESGLPIASDSFVVTILLYSLEKNLP
jgi:hypothetical protein